jgi:hypothetical protein
MAVCIRDSLGTHSKHDVQITFSSRIEHVNVKYLVISIWSIRVIQPPSVKLSRSSASPAPPTLPEPPVTSVPTDTLLSALSLGVSHAPTVNPIFGHVSLPTSTVAHSEDAEMDWTPADSTPSDRMNWLKPQRFFPPEQPTGLESLLAGASLADPEPVPMKGAGGAPSSRSQPLRMLIFTASCALLLSVGWTLRGLKPDLQLR